MDKENRFAGGYRIINSIHIGDKELLLGENMEEKDGYFYMTCFSEKNDLFERFSEVLAGNNFLEIAGIFSKRLDGQIRKTVEEEKARNLPEGIITPDMCIDISNRDFNNEVIVIKAEVLRPEYRTAAHQVLYCTGGSGARLNAYGRSVFCEYLQTGEHVRYDRLAVQGILKPEHYPDWVKESVQNRHITKQRKEPER